MRWYPLVVRAAKPSSVTQRESEVGVLSASSPSKSDPPHDGSLAGPVHPAPPETRSRVGVRRRVVRNVTEGAARQACAAYAAARAGLPERGTRRRSMHAWLPMVALKSVVLCRRPPNHAFEGSAQQRARCWVPSSLRSSAPPQRNRSASCGVARDTSARGMQAMEAHGRSPREVARGPAVPTP